MENITEPLKFLTVEETAELLQVYRRTLQRMIHRKDLPAFKVGGQWSIHEHALAKWLNGLRERCCASPLSNSVDPKPLSFSTPYLRMCHSSGDILDRIRSA